MKAAILDFLAIKNHGARRLCQSTQGINRERANFSVICERNQGQTIFACTLPRSFCGFPCIERKPLSERELRLYGKWKCTKPFAKRILRKTKSKTVFADFLARSLFSFTTTFYWSLFRLLVFVISTFFCEAAEVVVLDRLVTSICAGQLCEGAIKRLKQRGRTVQTLLTNVLSKVKKLPSRSLTKKHLEPLPLPMNFSQGTHFTFS